MHLLTFFLFWPSAAPFFFLLHLSEICELGHFVIMRLLKTEFIFVTWLWLPLNETLSGSGPRVNSSSLWSVSVKWLQTPELSNWVTSHSHWWNQTFASFQTNGSKTFWSVFTYEWPLITDGLIESEQKHSFDYKKLLRNGKLLNVWEEQKKSQNWRVEKNSMTHFDVLPPLTPGWKLLI